jgi:tRNA(adenine34) deaminase
VWSNLEKPWQLAMKLAWESFKSGSLPIAAVIADADGKIVCTGRNTVLEKCFKNRNMAHAEMGALMDLDYDAHPEIRKYTIYTTLEPCPMCMGAIVMSDVRKLRVAVRDPWAGAVDICQLPYIASKNMDIVFEAGKMPTILTVLYLYRLWEGYGTNADNFLKRLDEHFPAETTFARDLLAKNILRNFAEEGASIEKIYNYIEGTWKL